MLDYWQSHNKELTLGMDEIGNYYFYDNSYIKGVKVWVTKEDLQQLIKSIQVMI